MLEPVHHKGRDVLFAFQKDVGLILSNVEDFTEEVVLAKAAKIICMSMIFHKFKFDGSLQTVCLELVPKTLFQFMCMIEHWADIRSQLQIGVSKTTIAMAQLL